MLIFIYLSSLINLKGLFFFLFKKLIFSQKTQFNSKKNYSQIKKSIIKKNFKKSLKKLEKINKKIIKT